MKQLTAILGHIGAGLILMLRSFSFLPSLPRQCSQFMDQCLLIGYASLPIIMVLSFFIGSVLALQSSYIMQHFGSKEFIGSLVGLSMTRELGPVMVAILIAGRSGSAITAELASMKVYQEIDALVTMNIPPERMLVLPRLAAVLVVMPMLCVIANICGWYGGSIVCQHTNFISSDSKSYFYALKKFMDWKDVADGLLKAEVFGFVTVLVCCYIGLSAHGGPHEIGNSVTRAVVISLIFILVLDYFVTKALF